MKEITLDIGVRIPHRDTAFMDSIMQSHIADSGLESTGDVYFQDNAPLEHSECKISDDEFYAFLGEFGIKREELDEW